MARVARRRCLSDVAQPQLARYGLKSNARVASIGLNIVSPVEDGVDWVTVRPVIEYSVALELPPTSVTGTSSVMVPGLETVKLPWMLCADG